MRQLITNLIGNAIKFTEEGGVSLWIDQMRSERELLRIKVTDTGIGIPETSASGCSSASRRSMPRPRVRMAALGSGWRYVASSSR